MNICVVNVSERCVFVPFKGGPGGLEKMMTGYLFLETLNGPLYNFTLTARSEHLKVGLENGERK